MKHSKMKTFEEKLVEQNERQERIEARKAAHKKKMELTLDQRREQNRSKKRAFLAGVKERQERREKRRQLSISKRLSRTTA